MRAKSEKYEKVGVKEQTDNLNVILLAKRSLTAGGFICYDFRHEINYVNARTKRVRRL